MRRGTLGVWLALGSVGVAQGCSGRSVEIGGDPRPEGGTVSGGAFSGGATTGGAFPTGGVSGAFTSGGVSGAFPVGGTPASGGVFLTGGTSGSANGGSVISGGTAGASTNGGTAGVTGEGGDDGVDHYPPVEWGDGQGYRSSCPEYDTGWGFTCWNYEGGTRSCSPNGSPYCNACSCAVPCETQHECPRGITGAPADCIASATTAKSCFLVCDLTMVCPTGMTCVRYPGTERDVCMWVTEEPGRPP